MEGPVKSSWVRGMMSQSFLVERRVKRGSVFLLMDPLLQQLQASSLNFTGNSLHAGGFLHVDDIINLASLGKPGLPGESFC